MVNQNLSDVAKHCAERFLSHTYLTLALLLQVISKLLNSTEGLADFYLRYSESKQLEPVTRDTNFLNAFPEARVRPLCPWKKEV